MKGLNTNFGLTNGSFTLSSGSEKSQDAVWMLLNFDKFRTYLPEYNPGLLVLVQKPTSYLIQNQTLVVARLQKLIDKFTVDTAVQSILIVRSKQNRNTYGVYVNYASSTENKQGSIIYRFIG